MKTKAYIGNCPNCGRECMSGLKTTLCWNCETEFTIPTDMQEISYVNSTSIESKGCDNEKEPCEDAISRQAVNTLVDELARAISDERCCISRGRDTATIMQEILDLPSIQPQYTDAEIQKMQDLEQAEIKKAYELGKAEVLDKIRAEIAEYGSIMVSYAITKGTKTDKGIEKLVNGVLKQAKEQVLEIIDKYKAESEETETWNGIHAQITAPKGTFERIFNDADDDNDI